MLKFKLGCYTTWAPLPSWEKPSDQASTGPWLWPTPKTLSGDVPGASYSPSNSTLLAPSNVTSDDARRCQFGVAVFHEP